MFSLSQWLLNTSGMCTKANVQTYSIVGGLVLYAVLYGYLLMYNKDYLPLFNQYIMYIIGVDCLLATLYYYQTKKPQLTVHDLNTQLVSPLPPKYEGEQEQQETKDEDPEDDDISIPDEDFELNEEEFKIPEEVSNLLKAQSEMFERGLVVKAEPEPESQNEDPVEAKIQEIIDEKPEPVTESEPVPESEPVKPVKKPRKSRAKKATESVSV